MALRWRDTLQLFFLIFVVFFVLSPFALQGRQVGILHRLMGSTTWIIGSIWDMQYSSRIHDSDL